MTSKIHLVLLKIPKFIWKKIEHRIAYAVFQTTRVTNDHYGWKPQAKDRSEEDSEGLKTDN